MDFFTISVGIAVCLVTAGILFLISAFSFKERTFEEALAEQQKLSDILLKGDKAPSKNEKDKEKKPKKPVKKSKEKDKEKDKEKEKTHTDAPVQPTQPADSPTEIKAHVEFEPDPEIIPEEPPVSALAEKEKEKKKSEKKEKVKPILRNRDGHSPSSSEPSSPTDVVDGTNHFLENPPKDAVELKNGGKQSGKGTKTQAKASNTNEPNEVPVVEPLAVKEVAFTVGGKSPVSVVSASSQTAALPPPAPASQHGTPKKQRKKAPGTKSDSLDGIDGGEELLLLLGGYEKLLSAVRRVPLSAVELQAMIEILLNRQQEADGAVEAEWMEPGGRLDPLSSLKKQLAEKEKALKEEQEMALAFQNKLKTLGSEIATERTRSAAARKQLEESLARQTTEVQNLTSKLTQATEQHAAETTMLRNTIQHIQKTSQMSEENIRQMQRLQEEKNQLESHYAASQKVQQELASRVQQLEDLLRRKDQQVDEVLRINEQQRREQEAQFQNQLQIMAAQLQEAEQTKTALLMENGQTQEAQREILKLREALSLSESQALAAAREAKSHFDEMERNKKLLEDRISKFEMELYIERKVAAQKETESNHELVRLRDENQRLQDRLVATERDLHTERGLSNQKQSDSGQEVARLHEEIRTLNESLAQATSRLATAEHDFRVERDSLVTKESHLNEELIRLQAEVHRLQDRLKSAECDLQTERESSSRQSGEELARLREANQALTEQLSRDKEAEAAAQSRWESLLKEKDGEIETQKQKNNELREKNYKAMDALASAEKSLIELKKSAAANSGPKAVQVQRVAAVLQRMFPEMILAASSPSEETFAEEVASQFTAVLTRFKTEEEKKAQNQVHHYKTVLAQTEELLNRLQNRVEAEEQSWKSQVARLESDAVAVQQERDFWMEECQRQDRLHQEQLQETKQQSLGSSGESSHLQSRLESLEEQIEQQQQALRAAEESLARESEASAALRQQLQQESEKRKAAEDMTAEWSEKQRRLQEAEESLAREKQANEALRQQLEQVKAEVTAARVGSLGFMVGWSQAGHSSAAFGNAAAKAVLLRNSKSFGNLSSLTNPPVENRASTSSQHVNAKIEPAATNGNGNGTEAHHDDEAASHFGI